MRLYVLGICHHAFYLISGFGLLVDSLTTFVNANMSGAHEEEAALDLFL